MNEILRLVLSAGGAAVLAALINAVINRRKLSAEATQIITQAAAGTVENIMKDNVVLRERLALTEAELVKLRAIIELAEQRERVHQVEQERYQWHQEQWHTHCSKMAEKLKELGQDVGPPPPPWVVPSLRKKSPLVADVNDEEL